MRSFFLNRYRSYKKHLANLSLAAAAAAGLAVGSAQAALITVPNSNFETHPTSPPNFGNISAAPPWTGSGNWASGGYGSAAHLGTGFSWVDFGATITQTLTLADSGAGYTWAAGTYKLNGFIGDIFNGVSTDLTVTAELRNGTTDLSLGSEDSTATNNGGWNALDELTVVIAPGNPNIGAPIKLVFTGIGGTTVNQHRLLDDISLTFEAVPEPGSLTTLAIGTAALSVIKRRRRNSDC